MTELAPTPSEEQPEYLAHDTETRMTLDPNPKSPEITVVGIGASAGGLQPLLSFFEALPPDTGMAYVVVTHLHPERESLLDQLLQAHTKMPVLQVNQLTPVEADHVYVIPPNRNIILTDTHLDTAEFQESRGHRTPIDTFFRSLGVVHRKSIAIILSGGGSDGAVGIKTIKEQGGLLMVQEPGEAEYDSMPRAAIATGLVDMVLPVRQLAEKLVDYQFQPVHVPTDPETLTLQEQETLYSILAQVYARTGHDFSRYKRSTILRRIQRRMQLNGYATLNAYLGFLRSHGDEAYVLFSDLLIGVTNFFRDQESWQALAKKVIPRLFESKGSADVVRVWTIGCSTGEEAYSIAILLREYAATLDMPPQLQIFASDLDENALAVGREGLYPQAISDDVSPERLKRFFVEEGDHFRVRRELREIVLFADHSVLRDPPFSRLDLLICRNLLIYLERDVQDHVFEIFHYALNGEGYLFLGSSESAETVHSLFRVVDKMHRICQARPWRANHPYVPSLPVMIRRPASRKKGETRIMPRSPYVMPSEDMSKTHYEGLETYGPPSILVDEEYYILHLSETAGRFLLHPRGPLSGDLLKLVRIELQFELRAALFEAFEKNKAVVSAPILVNLDDHSRRVFLSVRPRRASEDQEGKQERLALVVFLEDETDESEGAQANLAKQGAEVEGRDREWTDAAVAQLEDEVHRLRERLQGNIEEYESSSEELKAANEELQSINEEYRSTTEELETSKEELQSINEELHTVNAELKSKMEEVSRAYSDLENLMAATDIATLFLDREFHIKWYTPGLERLFNIRAGDRGRPIDHLTNKMGYEYLFRDASQVLQTLIPIQRELPGPGGEWFLIRLRPYRTVEDRIDGVVITFVDVTDIKKNEIALRNREKELVLAQQSARAGFWTFTPQTEKVTVSQVWREIMGLPGTDEIQPLEEILQQIHNDDRHKMAALHQETKAGMVSEIEFRVHHPLHGERWILSRNQLLPSEDGHFPQFYGLFMDITERKEMESTLRAALEYRKHIVDTVDEGLLVLDKDLTVQFANDSFYESFRIRAEETIGRKIYELSQGQWDIPAVRRLLEEVLPNEGAFNDSEVSRSFEDLGSRVLLLNGRQLVEDALILLTINDVTEQRQAMIALYDSEQRLRLLNETLEEKVEERTTELEEANLKLTTSSRLFSALFQANPIPTAITRTTDGILLDANDEFFEYFACKREDVIDRLAPDWATEADRARLIERLMQDGFVRGMEINIIHSSGDPRIVLVSVEIAPVQGQDLIITSFIDITARVQAEQQIRELASQLTMAEQDVRHRLSQVLHDDLQQRLYAIELQMNFLREAVGKVDEEKLTLEFGLIKGELEEAIHITRHLSVDLSPPILHDEGLREALGWLAAQMREQYNLEVEIQAEESFPIPETDMRVLLFQSVRELLFNVVKHADVQKATVSLERSDHFLTIGIEDGGKGFDTDILKNKESGHGLATLRHRLNLFEGDLKVVSSPGEGTQIIITIPLQSAKSQP